MTTLDALWMGVPVVAFPGRTISSRLASATLSALGLTDFVAEDLDSYVELAVARTSDLASLARLRNTLRGLVAGSAFGDPRQCCCAVETAYRQMGNAGARRINGEWRSFPGSVVAPDQYSV